LFTPTAAVFVEVGKSRTLHDSKLASDATAYKPTMYDESGGKATAPTLHSEFSQLRAAFVFKQKYKRGRNRGI
jgi:hypothetical protein